RQMRFCHGFSGGSLSYCPKYGSSWDTAQGEKRRFYGHNCDSDRGGVRETPRCDAFSVGGATTDSTATKTRQRQSNQNFAHAAMSGCGLDVSDLQRMFFEAGVLALLGLRTP